MLVDGCVYGSISMTSFTLGMPLEAEDAGDETATTSARLPDPSITPADQTKL